MSRKALALALTAASGLSAAVWAAPASAAPGRALSCGDVVTTDVSLTRDLLNCPGPGLVVAAHDVTIDLRGHTIDGRGEYESIAGVENEGYDDVVVTNGRIRQFSYGVHTSYSQRGAATDLAVTATLMGVNVHDATGYRVVDNVLSANQTGLYIRDAAATKVLGNTIRDNETSGVDDTDTRGSLYVLNTVRGNTFDGISLSESAHAVLTSNTLTRNGLDGLNVVGESPGLVLLANRAERNDDNGLLVSSTQAYFAGNSAHRNGTVGIAAEPDAIDGGGNTASRNGERNCRVVRCR